MDTFQKSLIFSCFLLSYIPSHAQYITKIIPQYVLIDRDTGIGQLNEEIDVYRLVGEKIIHVGKVKILRSEQGKTGAKIVYVNSGMQMTVGDFVRVVNSTQKTDNESGKISNPISSPVSLQRTVDNRMGAYLARFVPASNLENGFENSYSIGASFKLITMNAHSFYIDLHYPLFKMESVLPSSITYSLLMIQLIDRVRIMDRVYYEVGGGLYRLSLSGNISGMTLDETRSYSGFFVGLSLDLFRSNTMTFTPTIRMHTYSVEKNWVEFVVGGVNVYFSVF